ncbi:12603_t:CDS:1, partial [Cetraspora pellucida]
DLSPNLKIQSTCDTIKCHIKRLDNGLQNFKERVYRIQRKIFLEDVKEP